MMFELPPALLSDTFSRPRRYPSRSGSGRASGPSPLPSQSQSQSLGRRGGRGDGAALPPPGPARRQHPPARPRSPRSGLTAPRLLLAADKQ